MNKSYHVKPRRKLPLYNSLSASLKINSFLSTYDMRLDRKIDCFYSTFERQMKNIESKKLKQMENKTKKQNKSLAHPTC
jgi:hypothetical protein